MIAQQAIYTFLRVWVGGTVSYSCLLLARSDDQYPLNDKTSNMSDVEVEVVSNDQSLENTARTVGDYCPGRAMEINTNDNDKNVPVPGDCFEETRSNNVTTGSNSRRKWMIGAVSFLVLAIAGGVAAAIFVTRNNSNDIDRLPAENAGKCFASNEELRNALFEASSGDATAHNSSLAEIYGWPIGSWCVSKVTHFDFLFSTIADFSEDLSGWDTSSVTSMEYIFQYSSNFSGDVLGWDTSSLTSMRSMFDSSSNFAGDVSGWDTSSVTSMRSMFSRCNNFSGDITGWNTSSVSDMAYTFERSSDFASDVSGWDTSSVTSMISMFAFCNNFAGDISGWDTSSVTSMFRTFHESSEFAGDITGWNTSSVSDMADMFLSASDFRQDLCSWGPLLAGRDIGTNEMFIGTNCPVKESPDLTAISPGPFCFPC
jgi:surface protein